MKLKMKADMLSNGLIALSAVDSRSRARGLCRYSIRDGLIKAEVSASQLAQNEEYIVIIWAASRPHTLGEMHKSQAGHTVTSEMPGKTVDAAFVAVKEAGGVRIVLWGRPLGSDINMNETLLRVRMHYTGPKAASAPNEPKPMEASKEPMPAPMAAQPMPCARSETATKPVRIEIRAAKREDAAPAPVVPIAPMKIPAVTMSPAMQQARPMPPKPAEPARRMPQTVAVPQAMPPKPMAPAIKIPLTATAPHVMPVIPLKPPQGTVRMEPVQKQEMPLQAAPPVVSEALDSILKRADTLFKEPQGCGRELAKEREQWQNEAEQLTGEMDGVDYFESMMMESSAPPALDRYIYSQNPRSIAPHAPALELDEAPPSLAAAPEQTHQKHRHPAELIRYKQPSYSKPISEPFSGKYPGASWVLARYPGTQYPHYLAAQWRRGSQNLLVIAVPGEYGPNPPSWLKGFTQHRISRWGQGYWISAADYATGKPSEG